MDADVTGELPESGEGVAAEAPSAIEITEDALIRPPGAQEPVKWSEWSQRYVPKAEFTRKTQELAREREQFQRERQQAEQLLIQRAQSLAQTAQQGGTRGQAAQDALGELVSQLKGLPYIDGATLANVIERVKGEVPAPLTQELSKRDQALGLVYRQMQAMQKQLQDMHQQSRSSSYQTQLRSTAKALGLPEDGDAIEILRDIYESHEGEDLDREFPDLARKRLDTMRKIVRAMDKAEADRARKAALPGKGGQASPAKGLEPKGMESARDIAEQFWSTLQDGPAT